MHYDKSFGLDEVLEKSSALLPLSDALRLMKIENVYIVLDVNSGIERIMAMNEQDILLLLTHAAVSGLSATAITLSPKDISLKAVDIAMLTLERLGELGYKWPKPGDETRDSIETISNNS